MSGSQHVPHTPIARSPRSVPRPKGGHASYRSPCNFGQPGRPRYGHVRDGRLDGVRCWGVRWGGVPIPVLVPRCELHRVHLRLNRRQRNTMVCRRRLGLAKRFRHLGIVRPSCFMCFGIPVLQTYVLAYSPASFVTQDVDRNASVSVDSH